ncbi:hypothetical protein [Asticcacaulis sp.]|uniref:hypothetical protein n=1 Tax=Asticcacaulis sp. TaxID=1872648 RepID=UPI0031CE1EEB
MIDLDRALHEGLPKDLLLDIEDRIRAAAIQARDGVRKQFPMSPKRSRGLEGHARFRLQEEAYEEVVQLHGGRLLTEGVITGTDLKFFQPLARFEGVEVGIVLGFATMPEKGTVPPKNKSRLAGVTLNLHLQPDLFSDDTAPKPTDIFVLFLSARDREHAGLIEEVAIGVIGADYRDYIYYRSLDDFLRGYGSEPQTPNAPTTPTPPSSGNIVKLRSNLTPFTPPEKKPKFDAGDGSNG